MKKIRIKLNKRGWILVFAGLFSLITITVVLIIGSLKGTQNEPTTGLQTDITPIPTEAPLKPNEPQEEENVTVTPSPKPVRAAETFVFPKEGVRPIAVMIDNEGNQVLPQGGIGKAQVVYEMLTEYGDTRYMAIFWDTLPELIGPVRSARHYFFDYAMEYDAIYTHIGYSDYAYRDLDVFDIDNINGVLSETDGVFWDLTKDRTNYHDSYTSPERLKMYLGKTEYEMETTQTMPFTYNSEDTDLPGTESGREVFIKYSINSNCGFYYDSTAKNYKRTRMGEFQIDRNTNETIRAKNIIILYVRNTTIAGDQYGRQEIYTTGGGKGFYITNGIVQEISWKKQARDGQTTYQDADGKKIVLNPGQTWIQIVPPTATVKLN